MREPVQPASLAHSLRECPDCGLIQSIPPLQSGAVACSRCGKVLRRARQRSSVLALALALTSLVLYCIAVWSPFLSVSILGQVRDTTMISLPAAFAADGRWELAAAVLATTIVLPLCKIGVVLLTLLGLRTPNPPPWLPGLFRRYGQIGPWAMIEVFLLGVFVAFTRLQAIATVEVGVALYALGALMLTMVMTDVLIDREAVWEEMAARGVVRGASAPFGARRPIGCEACNLLNDAPAGAPCTRCGATLHLRRPDSANRTWALLATAALFYLPANIYPVMTVVRLGSGHPSTILGGAGELLAAGMWPLALLVLVASVLVPMFKLAGLVALLVLQARGSPWRLRRRTQLYRAIEFIGRWSMIDVFMLATLVGLVRSGALATVTPGLGAVCFGSVVILTMAAAISFDPRVMWDAAARPASQPALQPGRPTTQARPA